MSKIKFTPENLLYRVDKIGGWSQWHLAGIALDHFFPKRRAKDNVLADAKLCTRMGCNYWWEVIIFYHITVGYTKEQMHPYVVNKY